MVSFDSVANTVIPWIIAIIMLYLLYKPLKKPLSGLVNGIKNLFRPKEEEGLVDYPYPNLEYD